MVKIQCNSCGSTDFERLGNNTLKCRYCGSIFALASDETVSQIGKPQKMPYSFSLVGDVLRSVLLHCSERPPIIKVPEGIKAIGKAFDTYDPGVFYELNTFYYHHVETTYENNVAVHRTVKDNLEEVILPEGLEVIGDNTFNECTTLKRINIPSTVKMIGNNAFRNCKALHEIALPEALTNLGGAVFSGSGLRTITIPGSIETIPGHIFKDCKELKTVTVLPGVQRMGEGIFSGCSALEHISLPSTLRVIGDHPNDGFDGVFSGCSSLKRLVVPDSVSYFDYRDISANLEYLYIGDKTFFHSIYNEAGHYYEDTHSETTFDVPRTRMMKELRRKGLCQYCGGSFVGLFDKKCRVCWKKKDY